jgi:hypothetical protein
VFFEIRGELTEIETFAVAAASANLRGCASFTERADGENGKASGDVKLPDGSIRRAELHWYEASGIGKKEFKIKRFVD